MTEPDDLWNLMGSLSELLQPTLALDDGMGPIQLGRTTVLGLFVRRIHLAFRSTSFEEICTLVTHFGQWVGAAMADATAADGATPTGAAPPPPTGTGGGATADDAPAPTPPLASSAFESPHDSSRARVIGMPRLKRAAEMESSISSSTFIPLRPAPSMGASLAVAEGGSSVLPLLPTVAPLAVAAAGAGGGGRTGGACRSAHSRRRSTARAATGSRRRFSTAASITQPCESAGHCRRRAARLLGLLSRPTCSHAEVFASA